MVHPLETQHASKVAWVSSLFAAFPWIENLAFDSSSKGSADFGYRRRVRLRVRRVGDEVQLGWSAENSHAFVAIDQCPVMNPLLEQETFAACDGFLRDLNLASEAELIGTLGWTDANMVEAAVAWVVRSKEIQPAAFYKSMASAIGSNLVSIGLEIENFPTHFEGSKAVWIEDAEGMPMQIDPRAFIQGCAAINRALGSRIFEQVSASDKVLELFAGSGNFTLGLLRRTKSVYAVEEAPEAIEQMTRNAERLDLETNQGLKKRLQTHVGKAQSGDWPTDASFALVDPPRAGLGKNTIHRLGLCAVPTLVYVSCDPQSLARDAAQLEKVGYRLESLELHDMFPQTAHVESLAIFRGPARLDTSSSKKKPRKS